VDKAQEYLAAGSRLAVLVEPDAFVELYRAGAPPLRLTLKDAFSVPELPGFGCKVADFFPQ
jgi:Uma2 family endonuclease